MSEAKTIQYQIIYWRDIPAQLRLRRGRARLSYPLPERFQKTVYRAAYRAKAITGDAYQESWHAKGWFAFETASTEEQDLAAAGEALAAEIIVAYDAERLDALALNEGHEPEEGAGD